MATLALPVPEQDLPRQSAIRFFEALHRYWGYESFRPGQENIVRSIAAGHDACVVMPTGGGKSLCYQLPAVLDAQRTVVVVSPLIALMQDQVAQLEQMGVPAGFLNSSLSSDQRTVILRRASQGEYRLLYLSPERIALDGTPAWLGRVPVSFFAIDEAHCISEWGHDFRPEYRQLSRLRELFPDGPIAAFTASATQRVRHDIIEQLRLRDPTNTSPASAVPICATPCANAISERKMNCSSAPSSKFRTGASSSMRPQSRVWETPSISSKKTASPPSAITARWKAPRAVRTRKNGWPTKSASWSAQWLSDSASTKPPCAL